MSRHVCNPTCATILAGYADGAAMADVARALALPYRRVYHVLLCHGIPPEPRLSQHVCTARCTAITTAYVERRESLETIGLAQRLSRERIRQILRLHAVALRPPGSAPRPHQCDAVCHAVRAATPPIRPRVLAATLGCHAHLVSARARRHAIAVARPGNGPHVCRERCTALRAWLAAHPDQTVYSAARALRIPNGWTAMVFLGWHRDEGWPMRTYATRRGVRVAVTP